MCQFHSFLFDNYTGDIYDVPNHVSHAVIAEKHGLTDRCISMASACKTHYQHPAHPVGGRAP